MIRRVVCIAATLAAAGCIDLGDQPWPTPEAHDGRPGGDGGAGPPAGSEGGAPEVAGGDGGQDDPATPGDDDGGSGAADGDADPLLDGPCPHPGDEPEAVGIEMSRNRFWPSELEVCVGDTVVWVNRDSKEHTIYTGEPSAPDGYLETRKLYFGDTYAHTFETPGEYVYYCSTHKKKMRDAVVVVRE